MNEQKSVAVAAVAAVTLIYEFQNFQVSDWPNQENPILFDQFCNFDANFHRINNTFVRNWYVFGHVVFFSLCFLCVIHPFPIHVPWCLIVCGQLIFQIEKVWNCCFFYWWSGLECRRSIAYWFSVFWPKTNSYNFCCCLTCLWTWKKRESDDRIFVDCRKTNHQWIISAPIHTCSYRIKLVCACLFVFVLLMLATFVLFFFLC